MPSHRPVPLLFLFLAHLFSSLLFSAQLLLLLGSWRFRTAALGHGSTHSIDTELILGYTEIIQCHTLLLSLLVMAALHLPPPMLTLLPLLQLVRVWLQGAD